MSWGLEDFYDEEHPLPNDPARINPWRLIKGVTAMSLAIAVLGLLGPLAQAVADWFWEFMQYAIPH